MKRESNTATAETRLARSSRAGKILGWTASLVVCALGAGCSASPSDEVGEGEGATEQGEPDDVEVETVRFNPCDQVTEQSPNQRTSTNQVLQRRAGSSPIRFTKRLRKGEVAGIRMVGASGETMRDIVKNTSIVVAKGEEEWTASGREAYVLAHDGRGGDYDVTVTMTFASKFGGGIQGAGCNLNQCPREGAEKLEAIPRTVESLGVCTSYQGADYEAALRAAQPSATPEQKAAAQAAFDKYPVGRFVCSAFFFQDQTLGTGSPFVWVQKDCPRPSAK